MRILFERLGQYVKLAKLVSARDFCARVPFCTRRLKIPSHLRTLFEFLLMSYVLVCTRRKKSYFALSSLFAFPRALRYLRSCTTLYTSLKNSVASTHAIRVFTDELCIVLCTAKKSYFALSSLFAFLRTLSYLRSCGLLLKFKNQ